MIRLGLRLAVNGGREAAVRLAILVAAVGLGVGLLLIAISGINAVNTQNDRYAWLSTGLSAGNDAAGGGAATAASDALWFVVRADRFDGRLIARVDVAATGPTSPVPPGIPRVPGPGEYYASPALGALLRGTPAAQLAARYPGHLIGTVGNSALPAPNSLVIVIGRTVAQMRQISHAAPATSISTRAPSSCGGEGQCLVGVGIRASGIDLIFSVVALAMLFPVLIFIGTATRLSAARREQRFAAMRLAGATPRQISLIAAVESTVAAVAGVALGFAIFFLLRDPISLVPFTGARFFPSDLSLTTPDMLVVALGVPVAAMLAARLALRRVHVSPLGVTRRVTPKPPRFWRVLPLLAGLAELGFFVVHGRPSSTPGQIQAFTPGFGLIMVGLVVAGPWLTMIGAKIMAGRTAKPGSLIAARRLADNPRGGFRAVSGLVLALFVTTVAVAIIGAQNAYRTRPSDGPAAADVVSAQFGQDSPAPPSASAAPPAPLAELRGVAGVTGIVEVHPYSGPGLSPAIFGMSPGYGDIQAGVASCAQLASIPAFGRCPTGAAAAVIPAYGVFGEALTGITWPAAGPSAGQALSRGVISVNVATDGSQAAVERTRTLLENAYPGSAGLPETFAESSAESNVKDNQYQQLADVVILTSLPIAGCTLAASIAAGLADRKRAFSLLRLAGSPLGVLRRVVALESAVPLLAVAVVSIGIGFAASAMFAHAQLGYPLAAPSPEYYLITVAGIAVSLAIIAATFPLLARITGPEVARND